MGVKELSDKGPDGTRLGQSSADLISFHGSTPCDQSATAAAVSTTAPVSGAFGFETSAQAIAVLTAINALLVCVKEKGLMAE